MNVIRGLLFDNLGLKFVALLLAIAVYLHVYTERPASMLISFPIQFADLPDSLSLSGPAPAAIQAEMRGTGKQLIRLRLTEPHLKLSLAGVGIGHYERALSAADLPIDESSGLEVERLVGPRMIELEVDRKVKRMVPLVARYEGTPANGWTVTGRPHAIPGVMEVTGPKQVLAKLDSLPLVPVRVDGRRDTLVSHVGPEALPDWCTNQPLEVEVRVPIGRAHP